MPMIYVLAAVDVEDFEAFWTTFTARGLALRQRYGSKGAQIYTLAEDPKKVTILFQWESRDQLEAFLQNQEEVGGTMRQATVVGLPHFTYLAKVGELEA